MDGIKQQQQQQHQHHHQHHQDQQHEHHHHRPQQDRAALTAEPVTAVHLQHVVSQFLDGESFSPECDPPPSSSPCSRVCDQLKFLWFVVCGLWFLVFGLWFVICGLWFVVCGLRVLVVVRGRISVRQLLTVLLLLPMLLLLLPMLLLLLLTCCRRIWHMLQRLRKIMQKI